MNHWLKIKMQHLAKLSTPQQLAKAAPPNHSQDQMTQAICNVFKSCFNKKQRSFGKRSFTPFIFRVVRKVPKRKVPQQHHQHQHHHLHWFLLCKPSQRLWGWPSLCSASSGWDVRNNIDVKKKHPPKFRSLLTWYHDTSKISFKWSEMGAFSGVLPTFVLLRTIKDGHTTNWQILAKSHYFLLMASQHSQLQTFKRTDIFPVSSFPESEMSSFCWSSTLQRCIHSAKLT